MLAKEGDEAVERGTDAVTSQYLKEGRDEHAMGGKCEHFFCCSCVYEEG